MVLERVSQREVCPQAGVTRVSSVDRENNPCKVVGDLGILGI